MGGEKKVKVLKILVLLAIITGLLSGMAVQAATIGVSLGKSVTSTTNYYERDPELLKASSGTWFLVYAKSQMTYTAGGNPDALIYDVNYSTSTDNGDTWTECDASKRMTLSGANFWPATIVEADGQIWIIASNLATGDIYYQATADDGGTWSSPTKILTATQTIGSFHLDAVAVGDDIFVFFAGWAETDGIYCMKYDSGTDSWGAPVQTLAGAYRMPRVIMNGSVFLMVSTVWSNLCYSTTSDPISVPWTTVNIPGTESPAGGASSDPSIFLDNVGVIWVLYAPWYSTDRQHIAYLTSSDNGLNWSAVYPFTAAQFGSNYWWDYRPYISQDGARMLIFFAGEQNDPLVTRGVADIVTYSFPQSYMGQAHFEFIQAAADYSQDGDNISMADGEYRFPLSLENKTDLTIRGGSQAGTIFIPETVVSWAIADYPAYNSRSAAVRVINSTGITLNNMTFDFDLIKGNNVAGILFWNTTGEISNNLIENMNVPDAAGGYYELTCYIRAPQYTAITPAEVNISFNTFLKTGRVGIIGHDYVQLAIEDNSFDKVDDDFGYAIELGSLSSGTIWHNTIRNYDTWAASDHSAAAGIYIENSFTTGLSGAKTIGIGYNEIDHCQFGIYLGNSVVGYAGNVLINALILDNNIHDNNTTGSEQSGGILVVDEGHDMGSMVRPTILNNTITNNGIYGILIYTNGNGYIVSDIHDNLLYGNGTGLTVDNFGAAGGSSYYVTVYRNTFANTNNAVDNAAGGYWDKDNIGNCWSDFATNSGYPSLYNVPGAAGTVDRYPNIDCGDLCSCTPGNADQLPAINLLDILYIISYKYQHGPAPKPYATCSGDANCDCNVDLLDILYLIGYKYQSGPKPCSCAEWLSKCDLPVRAK
jgi:hypothetical protein